MTVRVAPRPLSGLITVPASKSHTIRRLLCAALAEGASRIDAPLESLDTQSSAAVFRALGAEILKEEGGSFWTVRGTGGARGISPPETPLDVGNSGTTLFLALAAASLSNAPASFTGDAQIERRSAAPLLDALCALGVRVESRGGCVPISVCGPLGGGRVSLPCPTSQYLSALLLAAPLTPSGTSLDIETPLLNEIPYVQMTLSYLDALGVRYSHAADFSSFSVEGGAVYRPLHGPVAGDFSSAAFPALAAALSGGDITLANLDPDDCQGDKAFFSILAEAGARVSWRREGSGWTARVEGGTELRGVEADLNATPDLLPACAVLGAFARGESRFYNVAHARLKETDRIAVMARELSKLRTRCRELPDGLVIEGRGAPMPREAPLFDGHGDHRVVMALAAAALGLKTGALIAGSEAADVTYPGFLAVIGADVIH
jgi:3-phosphoshikimate 1-carboxyvinyltransferase